MAELVQYSPGTVLKIIGNVIPVEWSAEKPGSFCGVREVAGNFDFLVETNFIKLINRV